MRVAKQPGVSGRLAMCREEQKKRTRDELKGLELTLRITDNPERI